MQKRQLNYSYSRLQGLYRQCGISLVPVMVSIAILSSIAINYTMPQQQQRLQQTNVDATQNTAAQLLQAALSHYIEENSWPTQLADVENYLLSDFVSTNPWGYEWKFSTPPDNNPNNGIEPKGFLLIAQTGSYLDAMNLSARFGGISRICEDDNLCPQSTKGNFVHIGIAPP